MDNRHKTLNKDLSSMRIDYSLLTLDEKKANTDPFAQFTAWMEDVVKTGDPMANAMVLATADRAGSPDARVVLLKNISYGGFTFFTSYDSKKGHDLNDNPRATLLFFWKELQRQVKVQGTVSLLPESEADKYFESRPFESKVAAWASRQSEVVADRETLDRLYDEAGKKFFTGFVPRPRNWGGYVLQPTVFEFWQGRESRLHDRIRYRETGDGSWLAERLMP